jgi:hypothetical protein
MDHYRTAEPAALLGTQTEVVPGLVEVVVAVPSLRPAVW